MAKSQRIGLFWNKSSTTNWDNRCSDWYHEHRGLKPFMFIVGNEGSRYGKEHNNNKTNRRTRITNRYKMILSTVGSLIRRFFQKFTTFNRFFKLLFTCWDKRLSPTVEQVFQIINTSDKTKRIAARWIGAIHSLNLKGAIKERIQILMIATSKKIKKTNPRPLGFPLN